MLKSFFWNQVEERLRVGWRLLFFFPLLIVALIPVAPFLQIVKIMLLVAVTRLIRRYIDKRDMASLGFSFYGGWSLDILLGLGLGALLISSIFICNSRSSNLSHHRTDRVRRMGRPTRLGIRA